MILDSLTYIIEADNRKLDKEIEGSERRVDDLSTSMERAEARAKKLEKNLVSGFKAIGATILASVAATKLLEQAARYASSVIDESRIAQTAGVAIEDVSALGDAVERLGGNANAAQQTLGTLSRRIGRAMTRPTGMAGQAFQSLGVNVKNAAGEVKDATQVMLDLAESMEGLSHSEALTRLRDVGISDRATIELMLKGRQEMERLLDVQKELGVTTEKHVEIARKYTEAQARFRQATRTSADSLSRALLPAVTKMLDWLGRMVEWMNDHQDFVTGFFSAIALVLTASYLPAAIRAAIATWALLAPFLAVAVPVIALAAAFALLYDDVMAYLRGHDSLIGRILKDYPAVGKVAGALADSFKGVFRLLKGDLQGAQEAFASSGNAIIEALESMRQGAVSAFNGLILSLAGTEERAEQWKNALAVPFREVARLAQWLADMVGDAGDKIKDGLRALEGVAQGLADMVAGAIGGLTGDVESARVLVDGAVAGIGNAIDLLASLGRQGIETLSAVVSGATDIVTGALRLLSGDIEGAEKRFGRAIEAISDTFGPLTSVAEAALNMVVGTIKVFVNSARGMISLLTGDLEGAKQAFADSFDAFAQTVEGIADTIEQWLSATGGVIDTFASVVSGIFKLLTGDVEGARQAFADAMAAISAVFEAVRAAVVDAMSRLIAALAGGPEAAEAMRDAMVKVFTSLSDRVRAIFTGLKDFITGIWDWIGGMYDTVSSTIKDVGGWAKRKITGEPEAEDRQVPAKGEPAPDGGQEPAIVDPSKDDGTVMSRIRSNMGFAPSVPQADQQIEAARSNPVNAVTPTLTNNRSTTNNETNVQIGELNIETQAEDAEGISQSIKDELRRQLSDTQSEASSAVAR